MTDYTAYDAATGQVMYSGTCPSPDLLATPEVLVLTGTRYDGGWISEDQHHEVPEQPSPHHVWDWATKTWSDPRTLQDLRDAKWEQIKRQRDAAVNAPLVTPYGTFDADADSRAFIMGAIQGSQIKESLGLPSDIVFTLEDNTNVTFTLQQMVAVGLALDAQVQAAFNVGRALRSAIASATTPEQIEAISWPT